MANFTGTGGNDTIVPGNVSAGVIRNPPGSTPGAGNDFAEGGDGADVLRGGDGDDLLYSEREVGDSNDGAVDHLFGEAGNDLIVLGGGDTGAGGAGNDVFRVNALAAALIDGGSGNDAIEIDASDSVSGTTLLGIERSFVTSSSAGAHARADQLDDLGIITAFSGATSVWFELFGGGTSTFVTDAALTRITIEGSAEADNLTLAAGLTTVLVVEGGAGADVLRGGGGNDLLYSEDDSGDSDDNAVDQLFGEAGDDLIVLGEGDTGQGGAGNDVFRIDAADAALIDGGIGNDTIELATGDSVVGTTLLGIERSFVTSAGSGAVARADQLDELGIITAVSGSTAVRFELSGGGTSTFVTDTALTRITIQGSNETERLTQTANSTAQFIYLGGSGAGTVIARDAADSLQGGDGADVLRGGDGDDLLYSEREVGDSNDGAVDHLFGEAGNDLIVLGGGDTGAGGAGNDVFRVNALAAALIDGGSGNDAIEIDASDSVSGTTLLGIERSFVTSSSAGAHARADQLDDLGIITAFSGATSVWFELFGGGTSTFVTDAALTRITIEGSAEADNLTLAAGLTTVLVVEGGAGADVLRGGGGNDLLYSEDDSGDSDDNAVDQLFGEAGDDLIVLGEGDTGQGGAGNDTISTDGGSTLLGGDGNDLLIGGEANDILNGGGGNDTASYEESNNTVTVSLAVGGAQNTGGGGVDTLSGIENLIGGTGSDTLTGNGGANVLNGGAGGNDVLNGGVGVDTASYAGSGAVTVDLAVAGQQNTVGAGLDTLVAIENLQGGGGNDTLLGNGAANAIEGGAGGDVINGRGGVDTASYAAAGAVTVSLAVAAAQDTGGAGVDTLTGMENLLGSAFGDVLTGNAGANRLDGAAGDDVLQGGDGNDALVGGLGIDTASYAAAAAGVTVSLLVAGPQVTGGAGTDTLSGIENLTGSGFADQLIGDAGANVLTGGNGNDNLNAGEGDDTLNGGAGNDVLAGGVGIDTVTYAGTAAAVTVDLSVTVQQNTGGAGLDRLTGVENLIGGGGGDTLTGNGLANRLLGGNGDDVLAGGAGNDVLVSGAGADDFLFTPGGGTDTVTDFSESEDEFGIAGFGASFDTFGEVRAAAVQVGDDVVITLADPGGAGTDTVIVVENYLRALLSASDFAFITA